MYVQRNVLYLGLSLHTNGGMFPADGLVSLNQDITVWRQKVNQAHACIELLPPLSSLPFLPTMSSLPCGNENRSPAVKRTHRKVRGYIQQQTATPPNLGATDETMV